MDSNVSVVQGANASGYIRVADWSDLEITPVPDFVYNILFIYVCLVSTIAIIFNTLAFATFCKSPKLRIPINYLLMNLSMIDFLCGLFGGIPPIMANAAKGFFMGKIVCLLEGTTVGILGIAHLSSLGILSMSRYVMICKPRGITYNKRHAFTGIATIWAWSFAWNLPALAWDGYDLEGVGTYCGPSWQTRNTTTRIYFTLYFFCCFVLPFCVMCVSHNSILKHVAKISNAVSNPKQRCRYDEALRKTMIWMMGSFLVCWTPYSIIALYVTFFPNNRVNQYAASLPALFAKSSFICNPVIYFLLNSPFREGLMGMFCHTKPNSPPQTENKVGNS